jgi:exodeoxyribonuclease-5
MPHWSPQQDRALTAINRWLRDSDAEQCFYLFGYAGAGKTEIAHDIGQAVSDAYYVAFTGKATHVLQQRGCSPVSTIHRLIYRHEFDDEERTYIRELKTPNDLSNVKLLIVDEASMVNAELARDLLSFGIKTLIIADPAQLSPPNGIGYFMQFEPDVMLTEIHRQARDNPILRLADDIRNGKRLWRKRRYGRGLVITDFAGADEDVADHDVVLVGINDTRRRWNSSLRKRRNFICGYQRRKEPVCGETLVCLRNDYSVSDEIFNGQLWQVQTIERIDAEIPILQLTLKNEEGRTKVRVPVECFNATPQSDWLKHLQYLDFGYALTVHKAQGSEWSRVLLVDESGAFRERAREWLYTGITRAIDKLTIIDTS